MPNHMNLLGLAHFSRGGPLFFMHSIAFFALAMVELWAMLDQRNHPQNLYDI
jgi:hypothetical protein